MRSIQKRLEELEETVNPSGKIAMVFVRSEHKEEDYVKQQEEYFARWGDGHNPIFLIVTMYCNTHNDYEHFIRKMRERCPPGNCYTDWWQGD